ncbi:MAG TPA: zf-HC2 domain-containing protein, partial [Pyrinomonadaceae bacterium]|nr:zf-HC2 domain-containing protein [Pyrinomonadaceae bacterium]
MKCSEIRSDLSLYADAILAERESVSVKDHLVTCPLCRERYAEIREVKAGLRQMVRPEISSALHDQLRRSVRTEIRNTKTAWLPVSVGMRAWLYTQVMPYGVGTFASLLLGFTFLAMMFSGNRNLGPLTAATQNSYRTDSIMLASNKDPFRSQYPESLSASEYVQTRLDVSSESPSVNPRGALIALTRSMVRGGMKDDEVVIVADVFGNGLAQIAEV